MNYEKLQSEINQIDNDIITLIVLLPSFLEHPSMLPGNHMPLELQM